MDLDTTNGTFLNGERIEDQRCSLRILHEYLHAHALSSVGCRFTLMIRLQSAGTMSSRRRTRSSLAIQAEIM